MWPLQIKRVPSPLGIEARYAELWHFELAQ